MNVSVSPNTLQSMAQRTSAAVPVRPITALATALVLMLASSSAQAVDGCKVLLCLAAPDWKQIPECVPTIHQLHRDLARGKPFPHCEQAGAGTDSGNEYADPPYNCPPQYLHREDLEDRTIWNCEYAGAIWTVVNGQLFTRTWWNGAGGSVTEYSAYAKAQLGSWNPRFDDEHAAWLAVQPVPPVCPGCQP